MDMEEYYLQIVLYIRNLIIIYLKNNYLLVRVKNK